MNDIAVSKMVIKQKQTSHPVHPSYPAFPITSVFQQYESFVKSTNTPQMKEINITIEDLLEKLRSKKCGDVDFFSKSCLIAQCAFKGVVGADGVKYIHHCNKVASKFRLGSYEYDCAMLHDVVEMCEHINLSHIEELFNKNYARTLDNLTRRDGESYYNYISRLVNSGDKSAMMVKLSDLQHNMDMFRLGVEGLSEYQVERLGKYQTAYMRIIKTLNENE